LLQKNSHEQINAWTTDTRRRADVWSFSGNSTAATAGVSTKLKDNFGSRPLQDNREQELFSALKQNFNLQTYPALLVICRTVLVLVKTSAEARKSYRVCRTLPFHSLTPHLMPLRFQSQGLQTWADEDRNTWGNSRCCGSV